MKKWNWKMWVLALVLSVLPAVGAVKAEAASGTTKGYWKGTSYIRDGKKVTGLTTIGKKQYYFNKKGKLLKNRIAYQIKVKNKTAYFNIDEKGVAVRWTGAAELAAKQLHAIKAVPSKATDAKRAAALKKAFLWSAKLEFVNITKEGLNDKQAEEYFGKLGFARKKGDCTAQAATFALMAKVLRYDSSLVRGLIPTALGANGKPSKFKGHAWAEIKIGKKIYVFDPNFNTSSDATRTGKPVYGDKKTKGYYFQYGNKGTYTYYTSGKKLKK